MDELALAQKAVRRGILTEEQLREARAFAEGGRSLMAVLLDLGYLRAEDIGGLSETPVRPAVSAPRTGGRIFVAVLVAGGLGLALGRGCAPPPTVKTVLVPSYARTAPAPPDPTHLQWVKRAREYLARAEQIIRSKGVADTEAEHLLRSAAALFEEQVKFHTAAIEDRLALARSLELLRLWDSAALEYKWALSGTSNLDALLGSARCSLALASWTKAFEFADAASRLEPGRAEAHFLRGQALLAQNRVLEARASLLEAARLDRTLQPQVASLLSRSQ